MVTGKPRGMVPGRLEGPICPGRVVTLRPGMPVNKGQSIEHPKKDRESCAIFAIPWLTKRRWPTYS